MKRFGNIAMGALMLAGTAVGATLSTTAPADAHVSVGIGIGIPGPGYWGPPAGYRNPCDYPRYRYYHPDYCYGYGPAYYGPSYYGYYDQGYYGPGYYEPVLGGFWFTDSFGHRHYHRGEFHGGGFHGRGDWHDHHDRGDWRDHRDHGDWHDHDGDHWHH